MGIRWYSMDAALRTVDHETVDSRHAVDIADRYLAQLHSRYETGEEALAGTMFGFARDDGSYMQICINGPTEIDVEYDFPRIFKTLFQRLVSGRQPNHSESLDSRDALRRRIELFFARSAKAMREELATEMRK